MLSGLFGKKSAKAYYAVFSRYCSGDKGVGTIKVYRRAGGFAADFLQVRQAARRAEGS